MMTTKEKTDYRYNANSDALEMLYEHREQVIEYLCMDAVWEAPKYPNEYEGMDRWHHESYIDKNPDYTLQEAADLLEQLEGFAETDRGLWQGIAPVAAITCQAAYTYGNAIWHYFVKHIENLNDNLCSVILEMDVQADDFKDQVDTMFYDWYKKRDNDIRE